MFVARFVKALASLITMGIVAVGTPVVLVWLAAWPLPSSIPDTDDLSAWLRTAPTNQTLIDGIAILGWLAWAWFLLSLLAEAAVAVVDRPRDTGTMNPLRWVAAVLVGAIAASANSLTAHAHPSATVATADSPEPLPETNRPHATEVAADTTDDYRVRNHDNLWDIAKDELGEGTKWKTIFAENKNRVQPDGARFTDPNLIRPGWILTIPGEDESSSDTTDHPKPQPPPKPGPDDGPSTTKPSPPESDSSTTGGTSGSDAADNHGGMPVGVAIGASLVPVTVIAGVVYFVRAARRRTRDYEIRTGKPGPEVAFTGGLEGLEAVTGHGLDVGINVPAAFAHTAANAPIAVTDIAAGGIGLTGPGGHDAVRAAIAALITVGDDAHDDAHAMVITTSNFIDSLTTSRDPDDYTSWIRLFTVPDTAALHRRLTVDIVARTRHQEKTDHTGCDCPAYTTPLVVVARPDTPDDARELAALLHQGDSVGVYGIILGDWPHQTIHVAHDGATDDPRFHRCYQLDADAFTDLLDTLTTADRTYDPPITEPDDHLDDEDENTSRIGAAPRPPDHRHAADDDSFGHDESDTTSNPHSYTDAIDQPSPALDVASPSGSREYTPDEQGRSTHEPESMNVDATANRDETSTNTSPDESPAPAAEVSTPDGSLRLVLLGDTQILHRGQPVRFRRSRSLDLIAYLATQTRPAPVKDIQTAVIGHITSKKARKHLNAVITDARRALRQCTNSPDEDFIVYTNNHYQLQTQWFTIDIDDFDRHLTAAESTTDPGERALRLTAALDISTGEFGTGLDEDAFWAQPLRTHYRDRAYAAAIQLAEHHHSTTETPKAIKVLEHAVTINPHAEEALTRLIALHTETGDTEAARRVRQRLAKRQGTTRNTSTRANSQNIIRTRPTADESIPQLNKGSSLSDSNSLRCRCLAEL